MEKGKMRHLLGDFNADQSIQHMNQARTELEKAFDLISKVYWKAEQLGARKVAYESSKVRKKLNQLQKGIFDLANYVDGTDDGSWL